jgi:hypothetical protein
VDNLLYVKHCSQFDGAENIVFQVYNSQNFVSVSDLSSVSDRTAVSVATCSIYHFQYRLGRNLHQSFRKISIRRHLLRSVKHNLITCRFFLIVAQCILITLKFLSPTNAHFFSLALQPIVGLYFAAL